MIASKFRSRLIDLFKPKRRYRYRSSVTGLFVSKEYADANPDTTEREAAW